jgi:hypothetical protein
MNEVAKTVTFAAAAVAALGLGVWSHMGPSATGVSQQQVVGQSLFGELKPEAAKSLEIIEYDPETATLKPFKVAMENGLWRIPSHEDYPADASQQLGEAAAALVACEIINIESDEPSTHVTFGVIDPDPKSLTAGTTGVGKRVAMEDASGKKLAQVIIGKGIKDKPDLHYVRVPGQDRVYVAKLKTDKFSTKFEDWIEKDLLKLNAWDIQQVAFNDYSIDELRRAIVPRSKIQLEFDTKDSKWKLDELEVFSRESRDFEPQKLADDEELNSQKLNELKSALDDLKIVDVRRKPEGLAADLRVGEGLAENEEIVTSLLQRGFHLVPTEDGQTGIFSNEGEVLCGTKEGVQYTLRFGRIAGGGESETKPEESEESAKEKPADGEEGEKTEKKETGANRFIMVTVQFNEDLLTKPELTPLPGESPANDVPQTEGEEAKEDAKKTSAVDSSLRDAVGQLAQADPAGDDDDKEPTPQGRKAARDEEALIDDTQKDDAAEQGSAGPDAKEAKPAKSDKKQAKDDGKSADKKSPEIAKPKTPEQIEQERVTKENERKQKEYDEKVKKGKEKVKELGDRFADWYYVVSDTTYQKIHLGRDEIVKKKTPLPGAQKDEHDHDDDQPLLKEEDRSLPPE